jgi:hypothetical protein
MNNCDMNRSMVEITIDSRIVSRLQLYVTTVTLIVENNYKHIALGAIKQ